MNSTLSESQQQWYIRRGEVVRGPFPKEKITHYLLCGRIKKDDELSLDQKQWQHTSELPQLLTPLFFDENNDALIRQQLMAKKNWEAQRATLQGELYDQQAGVDTSDGSRQHRASTPPNASSDTIAKTTRLKQRKQVSRTLAGLVIFSLLGVMVLMIFLNQPEPEVGAIDCRAAAAPKVNWSNCQMEAVQLTSANLIGAVMQNMNLMRADLRGGQLVDVNLSFSNLSASLLNGADLRQATLVGVSLRGANLAGATFEGADLSYADLGGANISNANFSGARLDKVKWIDGRICAVNSVGRCQ